MAARVTSDRLIGRQDELAELRAALGAAVAGRPSLALVAGESGVGKTRLVRELAGYAREAGALVLCGESVELGEGELPYGPLLSALRPLVREQRLPSIKPGAQETVSIPLAATPPTGRPVKVNVEIRRYQTALRRAELAVGAVVEIIRR